MSQRRILEDDDELPVRPVRQADSWFSKWRRIIEDPPADACPTCGGTGWSGLFAGGGTICSRCGGSGKPRGNHNKTRRMDLT